MAAEVFQVALPQDGKTYFGDSHTSAGLRRSHPSSSSLFLNPPQSDSSSASWRTASLDNTPTNSVYNIEPARDSRHGPSCEQGRELSAVASDVNDFALSSSSTSDLSSLSSWSSTALSTGLTLDTKLGDNEHDDFHFPRYDSVAFAHDDSDDTRLESDDAEPSTTTDTTRSDSPLHTPIVVDDTAIKHEPSQHVDYLSHNWREEDIWASWKHIVSQRKIYGQRSRLENASWRTWAKSKNRLRTVAPEKLNWLKESDVTWLYGPLTPAQSHPITSDTSEPTSQISKSSSFINKKPILKKRSMSEAMLQRSLSSSSLLKQAAASVQAQQGAKHSYYPTNFGHGPIPAPSQPPSRDQLDYFSSRTSSIDTDSTPGGDGQQEKHIRFDEKVEQCIAVECKGGDISDDESDLDDDRPRSVLSESGSDEGLVMMKWNRRRPTVRRKRSDKPGTSFRRTDSFQARMIEEIEATTLKSRTDSPDVVQESRHHVFGSNNWSSSHNSRLLSPSPSQETLRPSRPSRNFLLGGDEIDDGAATSADTSAVWSFGASNPRSSLGAASSPMASPAGSDDPMSGYVDAYDGIEGMRRTESGMLMPYDSQDGQDAAAGPGLLGRVSETINTMRDIGHVLYTAFRT